ncbi:ABC transporter ATP-binding protein, partial [Variovorax sp. E3]|uniref:ABC transporter ATP-binding protein n=1 Tax=Variovorax sp. E3 TaxID=1914993 RepID=UPI0018DBA7A7
MASVTLTDVSKIYTQKGRADNRAVKSVNMAIDDGEIISLLGSSGCGKTSTLRMIAGFESVSEGAIRIGGKTINDLKPAERNVAMAFEGYALYPPLTVYNNIAFSLLRGKVPREEVRQRVRHVAELLEITDILDSYPPTLSGGQQQRVSLARALVRHADLYLLDEPMSQLEPQLRALLRGRIKDYLIAHRMTSVFVTHDQTEAVALSDRIAVMSGGVLQQFASPEDLKERPANLFVAGFIGEPAMNLLPATVSRREGRLEAVVAAGPGEEALRVSFGNVDHIATAAGLPDGHAVHLGVRP